MWQLLDYIIENSSIFQHHVLYWWGLDFSAFDKKGVFSRISLILTAFHEFVLFFTIHRNLCVRFTNLSLSLALSLKFVRSAQNYGEWRKNRANSWKTVKIKEIREKTPFFVKRWEILVPTNPTRFNRDKYSEKMTDSSLSLCPTLIARVFSKIVLERPKLK